MKFQNVMAFTEEAKALVRGMFETSGAKVAPDEGNGKFRVIMTTNGYDRDGERILDTAWDFEPYKKNPVVLWAHDFYSTPIGVVTAIIEEDGKKIAEGVFASTPKAQEVRTLYDEGVLNTVSVGFIPLEKKGNDITKAELLELSFVPVPANSEALALRRVDAFVQKYGGRNVAILDPEEGEEKGVVSDRLEAVNKNNEKWDKMRDANRAIGAFMDIWYSSQTDVAEYEGLLKELADILSSMAGAGVTKSGKIAEGVKGEESEATKALSELFAECKVGRVLSAASRDKVKAALDAMGAATTPLQELYEATDGDKSLTNAEQAKTAIAADGGEIDPAAAMRIAEKALNMGLTQIRNARKN